MNNNNKGRILARDLITIFSWIDLTECDKHVEKKTLIWHLQTPQCPLENSLSTATGSSKSCKSALQLVRIQKPKVGRNLEAAVFFHYKPVSSETRNEVYFFFISTASVRKIAPKLSKTPCLQDIHASNLSRRD
ncbi:hypothetical protein CEXT_591791 [Caerostris extrusa]|uniref:Uncharacterized protein n=1 Tax=Caerostris extrusa TaxID=172846 RepID=A0AAV4NTU1_CAEEX|nr:hypothetical protein CEXT_591791 [Caerostris extrusa]